MLINVITAVYRITSQSLFEIKGKTLGDMNSDIRFLITDISNKKLYVEKS